jgi:hypothetical protein
MSESATPESGPLSVDQAIASLLPPVEEEQAREAPVEAAEGEQAEGETSAPEEAEGEAAEPAEAEEAPEEAEPVVAVDPPVYWSKDAKAVFEAMTPEQQAVVLAQEGPREEITAKVKAEAAAAKQEAQTELGKVQQLADHLAGFLPQAIEAFRNRWGDAPDWKAVAQEHGAEAAFVAKAEYEEHLSLLQQTAQATLDAQAKAREQTVKAEFATLAEIAPDLADPEKGGERRTEITKYLIAEGLAPEAIKDISAKEMVLARKAMLWDRTQAALKAAPPKKPAAPAPKAPVRPGGASVTPNPTKQAVGRFHQAPTVDNAVALLLAGKA